MRDILIAEDNALLAKGICTALKSERYRVRHVADGAAALAAIAEQRPDVLVLDIMMPNTDGITACRTIRRTDAHLPILMLTARGLDSQKVEGLSAGADDYLTKPFSIAELIARIAALLRRALLAAPTGADRGRQLFSISVHELVKRLVGQAAAALDLKGLDIV